MGYSDILLNRSPDSGASLHGHGHEVREAGTTLAAAGRREAPGSGGRNPRGRRSPPKCFPALRNEPAVPRREGALLGSGATCLLALWVFLTPALGQPAPEGEQALIPATETSAGEPANPAGAQDPRLAPILRRMESVYEKLDSYRCDFRQVSETRPIQRRKESSGKLFFRKPDRMRWSYLAPEVRDIYLTEDRMTIYLPERNTVFLQPLGDALAGAAPARLFLGPAALGETFRITLADLEGGDRAEDTTCLRLTPWSKRGMSVEEVLLWVGSGDCLPRKTQSRDILGNVTTLHFLQGKMNVELDEALFRFHPPPGTEIVENLP